MGWQGNDGGWLKPGLVLASAAALLSFGLVTRVSAVKTEKAKVNVEEMKAESGNPRFASIPVTGGEVFIIAESSKVKVSRSTNVGDVVLYSNAPANWSVAGKMVRQCGFASGRKGTAMMSDALGARAIVNGKVYALPSGPMKGLQMNKDGLFINGQLQQPLKGSDIPGTGGTEDLLEIKVPDNFSGLLKIGAAGASDVSIQSMKNGTMECYLLGTSNLSTGKLEGLAKVIVDNRGIGKAEVDDLSAKVLVVNVNGKGTIHVKNGSADVSNATVSGEGSILLNGKFKGLQKDVQGTGKIEVTP